MKTTFTITIDQLANLLSVVNKAANKASNSSTDPFSEIVSVASEAVLGIRDSILDILGVPPESSHDWNSLSQEEVDSGVDSEGVILCCRDNLSVLMSYEHCIQHGEKLVICSVIKAVDKLK